MSVWRQLLAVTRLELLRERRRGEVAWVVLPFGAIALLVIPLAIGTDTPTLRRVGPGLVWVIVLLFGVMISARGARGDLPVHRDLAARLGIDPVAKLFGSAAASAVMLLVFELLVIVVALALYDFELSRWPWLLAVVPLAAIGLATLGTIAASLAGSASGGPALVPFLVAPFGVPLLLGATQALDGIRPGNSILPWVLTMVVVDLVVVIAAVVVAGPLQETQ
jgi:heme exporter protein B